MACAIAGVWMRSLLVYEAVGIASGQRQHILLTMNGTTTWIGANEAPPQYAVRSWEIDQGDWIQQKANRYRGVPDYGEWCMPYSSVVVPLTLLSAYLILAQSRKRPTASPPHV